MKLNEVVKSRRLALGLTQEQVGDYLGVSPPAVSKWETGTSYPDITLLPPLARLLGVDLNTLLSFQDSLTDQEIGQLLNQLTEKMEQEGFPAGFHLAQEKLREFPGSPRLLGSVAMQLQGGLLLYGKNLADRTAYEKEITALLERAAAGDDPRARDQALHMLMVNALNKGEIEQAEALLSRLPVPSSLTGMERRGLEARLRLAQGQREAGYRILEEELLASATRTSSLIFQLLSLALEDGRQEDAAYLSQRGQAVSEALQLWSLSSILSQIELAKAANSREQLASLYGTLLEQLPHPWKPQNSPLYCHIPVKDSAQLPQEQLLTILMQEIEEDASLAFLQEDEIFLEKLQNCRLFFQKSVDKEKNH